MAVRAEMVIEGGVGGPEHEPLFAALNEFLESIGETSPFGPGEVEITFIPRTRSATAVTARTIIQQANVPALILNFRPNTGYPAGWKEFYRAVERATQEAIDRTPAAKNLGLSRILYPDISKVVSSEGISGVSMNSFFAKLGRPEHIQIV